MPNFDAGHYFLSSLIPIQQGILPQRDHPDSSLSHIGALRELLAVLPRTRQSGEPSEPSHPPDAANHRADAAPFSRELHTHFCRLVVVDEFTFVGRQPQDAIVSVLLRRNPVIPQPVDHLPFAYLALLVEFDAPDGSRQSLRNYLESLWQVMAEELTAIVEHCVGFDPANPKASFLRQVQDGQLETTLSFHDYYWQEKLPLVNQWPRVLAPPLAAAIVGLGALYFLGPAGWLSRGLLLAFTLLLALLWVVQRVIKVGMEPFPAAPRSDLQSVLKALYLQRRFIDFMIANQGVSAETLQAEFQLFIDEHQPQSLNAPTQAPGWFPS